MVLLLTVILLVPSTEGCGYNEFRCEDGLCINATEFCNNTVDCRDESDETLRNIGSNYGAEVKFCRGILGSICVMSKDALKNQTFCNEDLECRSNEFPCKDGSKCLKGSLFCNGFADCGDKSDEISRDRISKYDLAFTFLKGYADRVCVLPDERLGIKRNRCSKVSDEDCLCRETSKEFLDSRCFRCLSLPNFVIKTSQLCDGIPDCPDLSDECLCAFDSRLKICGKLTFAQLSRKYQPHLNCVSLMSNKEIALEMTRVCDGKYECLEGEDEHGCSRNETYSISPKGGDYKEYICPTSQTRAKRCDGIAECDYFMEEECNCSTNAEFCKHLGTIYGFWATCCPATVYPSALCNGVSNCNDSADERGCRSSRFYCTDEPLPNIPLRQRCDKYDDCPNAEDETSCPYFFCKDNGTVKYLPKDYKCDRYVDCESGVDEADCVTSVFSTERSMISNQIILALVWIISLCAIIGCVAVICVTTYQLLLPTKSTDRSTSGHSKLIRIQMLSLSVSDLLVAVYTFIICIKAVEFHEDYFIRDSEWRGSLTCSVLGVLVMIGSEQSVFTMVFIATSRLHSVLRPFSQPNMRRASLVIFVTWIISSILAVIPLFPSAEDYFVKSVSFTRNQIFRVIYKNETGYLIDWLRLMHNGEIPGSEYGTSDWTKFKKLATDMGSNFTALHHFGYYSSHTVCLPTFFPDRSQDEAWGYTLFLLVVNSLAFLSMLIVYIVLYRQATTNKAVQRSTSLHDMRRKQNDMLQRKLTRIVISDFLCWIPICILGFLQMGNVSISNDVYLPAGLLVIPINSALNPLLYSDIPDMLVQKVKKVKSTIWRSVSTQQESLEMEVMNPQSPTENVE